MALKSNAPSTGIGWLDALVGAFRSDPMAGLSPMPMAGGAASMVSPGAYRLLQMIGQRGAERVPWELPMRAAGKGLLRQARPLESPAAQLPMPVTRARSMVGDINTPQVVLDILRTPSGREHYLRLLNRTMEIPGSPVATNTLQSGAYELLLESLLGGRLP